MWRVTFTGGHFLIFLLIPRLVPSIKLQILVPGTKVLVPIHRLRPKLSLKFIVNMMKAGEGLKPRILLLTFLFILLLLVRVIVLILTRLMFEKTYI